MISYLKREDAEHERKRQQKLEEERGTVRMPVVHLTTNKICPLLKYINRYCGVDLNRIQTRPGSPVPGISVSAISVPVITVRLSCEWYLTIDQLGIHIRSACMPPGKT